LIDESEKTIEILLWGLNARVNFYSLGQILVIKNARISCHSNKILGSGDEYLYLFVDLKSQKRYWELKSWLQEKGGINFLNTINNQDQNEKLKAFLTTN